MAVAVASSSPFTSADHGGASATDSVDPPSGLAAGDTWLIVIGCDIETNGTIATPSGWSAVAATGQGPDGYPKIKAIWKIAGASESAVGIDVTNTYIDWAASIRITGAHASAPIGNVSSYGQSSSTGTTQAAQSVTIAAANSGAISVWAWEGDGSSTPTTMTAPGSMTMLQSRVGAGTFPQVGVAFQSVGAGTFSPGNWSCTRPDTDSLTGVTFTFEIVPAAAGGSRVIKMAGEAGGFAGSSGGCAG